MANEFNSDFDTTLRNERQLGDSSSIPQLPLPTEPDAGVFVRKDVVTAKGDVIVGTAANAVARLGVGSNGQVATADSSTITGIKWATPATGSVTSVSVVTANGVSGTVATATTTPAITLTLGAITPSSIVSGGPIRLKGYTVATLPAGTTGDMAYATDLLGPTFLAVAVGGGLLTGPVFYNGSSWVTF